MEGRGMAGARELCHLCGIPKPPEWNRRQREREKMPRMPRIFDVKIIRTDDGAEMGEPDRSLGF